MPTAAIEAIAVYAGATAADAAIIAEVVEVVAVVATAYATQDAQRRQQNAAKDAYNASLRDRYVMVRGATEPRQIVLGRCRVSGPMFFVQSYGPLREHLVFTVALAAHEIDAVEEIYFDDQLVILDGGGNVLGVQLKETFSITTSGASFTVNQVTLDGTVTAQAVYGTTIVPLTVVSSGINVTVSGAIAGQVGVVEIRYQPNPSPFTNGNTLAGSDSLTTSATSGTFTLSQVPIAGTVIAAWVTGSGDSFDFVSITVSMSGSVATWSGAPGLPGTLHFSYSVLNGNVTRARIRTYLGGAGQAADAPMVTDFPGVWSSADTVTSVAYLVVELDYDPTAFPAGVPNVSALIRGAKVYDPRTGITAWTDNSALLIRGYATSPLGGRLDPSLMNDTSFIAAANVCDTTVTYLVNGQSYVRPLYRAGISAKTDARPQDVINDLAQSMAGRWAFVDGLMRVSAGAYTTPVLTLDETWLHNSQQIQVTPKRARGDVINVVTATFADEDLNYQVTQMPRVAPSTYIAEDGTELPLDVTMAAVQFTGQAQQVAGWMLRDSRYGMTLTVLCNMKAYPLELFDVINVTLDRFGWVNKTFLVQDINWTFNGGIQLSLRETDATVTALGGTFSAFSALKQTRLPSPWIVAQITSLAAVSGTAQLLAQIDGTITSRILVTWDSVADQAVLSNGTVEVRYGTIDTDPSTWTSVETQGTDTQLYINGVRDGAIYVIKARAKNALVFGQWTAPITNQVVGKTGLPSNVAGFTGVMVPGGLLLSWTQCADADYASTRLNVESTWHDATTPLFIGKATSYFLDWPSAGAITILAKNVDTSGNLSATASAVAVTINGTILVDTPQLASTAATEIYSTTTITNATVTQLAHTPDGFSTNTEVAFVTFTPAGSGQAQVFVDAVGTYVTTGAGSGFAIWSIQDTGATYNGVSVIGTNGIPASSTSSFPISTTRSIPVTGGTAYTFALYANKFRSGDTFTVSNLQMRVEVVKR